MVALKRTASFFFLLLVCDIKFLKSETTVKRKMLLQRIDFTMRRNDHCRHLAGLCTFLLNTFCCVLESVEQLQHWHLQKLCFVAQYTDRKEYWEESTVLFSTQHKKRVTWVPETIHARFPVSVQPCRSWLWPKICRPAVDNETSNRTREKKTSGAGAMKSTLYLKKTCLLGRDVHVKN